MTHVNFVLFKFSFLQPLCFFAMLFIAVFLTYKISQGRKGLNSSDFSADKNALLAKTSFNLSDKALSHCFYLLLFAKFCLRIYIVYTNSR